MLCQSPILAIIMKIPKVAKIVCRPSGATPANSRPPAKARMQKPQGGGKFLLQIPGVRGGWLWQKTDDCISQLVKTGVSRIYDTESGAKFFYCIKCIEIFEADHKLCSWKDA